MTNETTVVHDPFLNKDVETSTRLLDRLRGKYAIGPTMPNGEPEFGWREFPVPPIQHEAAAEIERLKQHRDELAEALRLTRRALKEEIHHITESLEEVEKSG